MEMPKVVVLKFCNMLTFGSVIKEIILKHKKDSQWGTGVVSLTRKLHTEVEPGSHLHASENDADLSVFEKTFLGCGELERVSHV